LNDTRRAGGPAPLEVRIARKAYRAASGGRLDVLDDVTLALPAGEVGALIGPSGCGKTTMLRIIAGLDRDYDGTVRRPAGRLAMVFQEPRLLPWRTVEDNVRLVAPDIDDAALTRLFDLLELSAHRTHFPRELSLGLARRAALARAFAVDPALLLLDEPFVSLDAALAVRLREELALLIDQRAVTALLVTHDLAEAARLADRVFLLSPRPARVLAEIPLRPARRDRSETALATMTAQLTERVAALAPGRTQK